MTTKKIDHEDRPDISQIDPTKGPTIPDVKKEVKKAKKSSNPESIKLRKIADLIDKGECVSCITCAIFKKDAPETVIYSDEASWLVLSLTQQRLNIILNERFKAENLMLT